MPARATVAEVWFVSGDNWSHDSQVCSDGAGFSFLLCIPKYTKIGTATAVPVSRAQKSELEASDPGESWLFLLSNSLSLGGRGCVWEPLGLPRTPPLGYRIAGELAWTLGTAHCMATKRAIKATVRICSLRIITIRGSWDILGFWLKEKAESRMVSMILCKKRQIKEKRQ